MSQRADKMKNANENRSQQDLKQETLDGRILEGSSGNKKTSSRNVFPKTVFLKRRAKFERLFNGFYELRGVTYVTSPEFLLDLYVKYDFEKVELIIGDGIMDGYKQELDGNDLLIGALFSRVEDETLIIHGTKATIHSKIYILTNDDITRIICGSPNLSKNAEGNRQREYAWYIDIKRGDHDSLSFLQQINQDYSKHLEEADIVRFMEDLQNLRKNSENERKEDFLFWSGSENPDSRKIIRGIVKEVQEIAFIEDQDSQDSFSIVIPKSVKEKDKKILLTNLNGRIQGGKATFSRSHFLNERSNLGMPRMKIDGDGNVIIGLGGQKISLPENITKEELDSSLSDIEEYIELVDEATCFHKDAVKMNMMEAVLYTMAAPFSNEWLRQKRKKRLLTDKTGPKHLVIFGAAGNGKTTFGRFQNHLLSGQPIEPINGKNYTKPNWDNLFDHVMTQGSPFPVIIDDIKASCFTNAPGNLEGRVKTYFENEWSPDKIFPMMIFNTNHGIMSEWAGRRVRKLDFLLRFKGNEQEQMKVEGILSRNNHVFSEFSRIYSTKLSNGIEYNTDELKLAREVFQEMYQNAERELPSFFPLEEPEQIYDMDAIYCREIESWGLFTEETKKTANGDVLKLEFETNRYGSSKTLEAFGSRLPPEVSTHIEQNKLIIRNPKEYRKFMDSGRPSKKGLLARLFG
jgi:hypothetical protein